MCLRLRSLLGRKRKKNKDDLDYFDAEGFGHEEEMRDAVLVAVDQAVHEVDEIIYRCKLDRRRRSSLCHKRKFSNPYIFAT